MQLTTVKELFKERDKYLNQEIQVGGWIRSIRDSKAFGFIVLNDGTSFDTLQIVYHDTMANFAEVSKLNVGAAIIGNQESVAVLMPLHPPRRQTGALGQNVIATAIAHQLSFPLHCSQTALEHLALRRRDVEQLGQFRQGERAAFVSEDLSDVFA